MLYQLSYTPKQQILSFIELPYEHRDTALETAAKIRCELRFYAVYKQWQSSDITVYITIQIRKDENKIIGKMSYMTEYKGYYSFCLNS